MRSPSPNSTPSTLPVRRRSPWCCVPSRTRTPSSSIFRRSMRAADGVDLALHQRVHQVHDGDLAALHLEAAGRFEPEQAAADHHRPGAARRRASSSARVSSSVRNAKTPSRSSPAIGGIHAELPVASSSVSYGVTLPSAAVDGLLPRIDVGDPHADPQLDAVLAVPLERVQRDLVGRLLAGQHRRQQDAVVVDVGLVAEDRDVELRRVLQDLFDAGHAGHAVADDDQRSLRRSAGPACRLGPLATARQFDDSCGIGAGVRESDGC